MHSIEQTKRMMKPKAVEPPAGELPGVSVVIPCYNVAGYVEEAVASAMAQSHPPVEVICVDDGSTDGTLAVLESLHARYPGTVRVLSGPNGGACHARNRGMKEATGAWIQFLDADDLLLREKVATQLEQAESLEGVGLVCGSYQRVSANKKSVTVSGGSEDDWVNLVSKRCGITSANLWHRDGVQQVGGWNLAWKSSQEYELMFRLLQAGTGVAYSPDVHTTLRAREGSISDDFDVPTRTRYLQLRADVIAYLEELGELTGQRRELIHEVVFKIIRGLYPLDPDVARAYLNRVLPAGYMPPVSAFNGRVYVATYRLLGLRGAEWMRSMTGKT